MLLEQPNVLIPTLAVAKHTEKPYHHSTNFYTNPSRNTSENEETFETHIE